MWTVVQLSGEGTQYNIVGGWPLSPPPKTDVNNSPEVTITVTVHQLALFWKSWTKHVVVSKHLNLTFYFPKPPLLLFSAFVLRVEESTDSIELLLMFLLLVVSDRLHSAECDSSSALSCPNWREGLFQSSASSGSNVCFLLVCVCVCVCQAYNNYNHRWLHAASLLTLL